MNHNQDSNMVAQPGIDPSGAATGARPAPEAGPPSQGQQPAQQEQQQAQQQGPAQQQQPPGVRATGERDPNPLPDPPGGVGPGLGAHLTGSTLGLPAALGEPVGRDSRIQNPGNPPLDRGIPAIFFLSPLKRLYFRRRA